MSSRVQRASSSLQTILKAGNPDQMKEQLAVLNAKVGHSLGYGVYGATFMVCCEGSARGPQLKGGFRVLGLGFRCFGGD